MLDEGTNDVLDSHEWLERSVRVLTRECVTERSRSELKLPGHPARLPSPVVVARNSQVFVSNSEHNAGRET